MDPRHLGRLSCFLSPEQPVPKGYEGGGVEGTEKYEKQKVETHHESKMVSEEPGGAAGMSGEKKTPQPLS